MAGLVLIFSAPLVITTQPARAEECTTVLVVDSGLGEMGISAASVTVLEQEKRTDENGKVEFCGLEAGNYLVTVRADGFDDRTVDFTFPEDISVGMSNANSSEIVVINNGDGQSIPENKCDCSQIDELRREFLEYREGMVSRWIDAAAVYLALIALIVCLIGYVGYQRVREIENKAQATLARIQGLETVAESIVLGTGEVRRTDLRALVGGGLLLIVAFSSYPIDKLFTTDESWIWELPLRLLIAVSASILILPRIINRKN